MILSLNYINTHSSTYVHKYQDINSLIIIFDLRKRGIFGHCYTRQIGGLIDRFLYA